MSIFYSDPYKDRKFGKLKGDKRQNYFKVTFSEAKFYKHENAYILAGQFDGCMGVTHSYTGSITIESGLAELPIYGDEYDYRQKKVGTGVKDVKAEYETIRLQPSIAESLLYKHIQDNPSVYLEGNTFKGSITFYPDDNYTTMDETERLSHVLKNSILEQVTPSGNVPEWIPPKPYSKGGSYGGYRGISPDEKLEFLKNELSETVNTHTVRSDKNLPIAAYIHAILSENSENERFLVTYFDLVKSLIS